MLQVLHAIAIRELMLDDRCLATAAGEISLSYRLILYNRVTLVSQRVCLLSTLTHHYRSMQPAYGRCFVITLCLGNLL